MRWNQDEILMKELNLETDFLLVVEENQEKPHPFIHTRNTNDAAMKLPMQRKSESEIFLGESTTR